LFTLIALRAHKLCPRTQSTGCIPMSSLFATSRATRRHPAAVLTWARCGPRTTPAPPPTAPYGLAPLLGPERISWPRGVLVLLATVDEHRKPGTFFVTKLLEQTRIATARSLATPTRTFWNPRACAKGADGLSQQQAPSATSHRGRHRGRPASTPA
jgi:hypothetical protein